MIPLCPYCLEIHDFTEGRSEEEADEDFLFTHFAYNSQGRCLQGIRVCDLAPPVEKVRAYLRLSGGKLRGRTWDEPDYLGTNTMFFEQLRGKVYRRFIACG